MSTYKRIGVVKTISEIPFDDEKIFTGTIGQGWLWRMKGKFIKQSNKLMFRDANGCVMEVNPTDKIDLAILERT